MTSRELQGRKGARGKGARTQDNAFRREFNKLDRALAEADERKQ
jgi:hypothetical protein